MGTVLRFLVPLGSGAPLCPFQGLIQSVAACQKTPGADDLQSHFTTKRINALQAVAPREGPQEAIP
jgi:hypothetical protein